MPALWPSLALLLAALLLAPWAGRAEGDGRYIAADRRLDVLPGLGDPPTRRRSLLAAGRELGEWKIDLAGIAIDGPRLIALASVPEREPLARAVRENLGRPVDLDDLLLFLDDVLRDGRAGARGELVWVTPGRARKAGILLHPDDVFLADRPRRYGVAESATARVAIDRPRAQTGLPEAADWDAPGPSWTMRYRNPSGEPALLRALAQQRGAADFAARVRDLIAQLRQQGAQVHLSSTVRSRHRGYLMWGAYLLSRTASESEFLAAASRLEHANTQWRLFVPIRWRHPSGWRAAREAAREMADTYDVVYATEAGARRSNHYAGEAVDLTALALPRRLELRAPDGALGRFDLASPEESRDLSLSPQLIEWVESHYRLRKLRSDYPHWDDAAPR